MAYTLKRKPSNRSAHWSSDKLAALNRTTCPYTSRLNQVENRFASIQHDAIAGGMLSSVKDLGRTLTRYFRQHNKKPTPIQWKYDDPPGRIRPGPFQ
ncbi:hypothetical protein [Cupriavidus necator]